MVEERRDGHEKLYEELNRRNIRILGTIPYDQKISASWLDGRVSEGPTAKKSVRRIIPSLLKA
ncbi:MAG: hypothetical protein AMJ94_15440 [Deltaproteobacteria bacterium SM23_61]|nr:MAG: hypothetical protein AMJ94_15440 [Deltaproteobacteria bacterium SM23_61]